MKPNYFTYTFDPNRDAERYGLSKVEGDYFEWRKNNPNKGKTRNNKIRLGDVFEKFRKTAEYYVEYCKHIPEEEREEHAEIVEKFTTDMEEMFKRFADTINEDIYGR